MSTANVRRFTARNEGSEGGAKMSASSSYSNAHLLDAAKHDGPALFAVLGIERHGNHRRCPFHDDKTPSMSVWHSKTGWRFKCHAGGCIAANGGTIIDALMLQDGLTEAQAIQRLIGGTYIPRSRRSAPTTPSEPLPPVPNALAIANFTERAQQTLLTSPELQALWLTKRKLTLEAVMAHGVGFLPEIKFEGWRPIHNVWVLPICDAAGNVLAVKFHSENPSNGSKCSCAPFGTEPRGDPRHAWTTLWPAPENFDANEPLFLVPGELKALRCISIGRAATSITSGEGSRCTPALTDRLRNRDVVLVFDADPDGMKFRDKTVAALHPVVRSIRVGTHGTL
jgi:hypothetical protein